MKKSRLAIVALLSALMITPSSSDACSRAVYFGKAGRPSLVGRWTGLCQIWTPQHVALSTRTGTHKQHQNAFEVEEQIRKCRDYDLRRCCCRRHE